MNPLPKKGLVPPYKTEISLKKSAGMSERSIYPIFGGEIRIPFQSKPVWFADVPRSEMVIRLAGLYDLKNIEELPEISSGRLPPENPILATLSMARFACPVEKNSSLDPEMVTVFRLKTVSRISTCASEMTGKINKQNRYLIVVMKPGLINFIYLPGKGVGINFKRYQNLLAASDPEALKWIIMTPAGFLTYPTPGGLPIRQLADSDQKVTLGLISAG